MWQAQKMGLYGSARASSGSRSPATLESSRVDYLGLILEKGVTRMDPAKVAGAKDWPMPTTVKQVRSFLGFCNFYRAFIRGFSHLAKPLNNLTKKDTPWTWGKDQQNVFDTLREWIITEPVLVQPDLTKPFKMEVDSSGFARGAVLLQRGSNGKKHPIAFYSQTLTNAERNYPIKDLEFSAIVYALLHWRLFLAGSPHDIIVHTDHANLMAWTQPQKISRRVARLVQALEEFPIKLKHISGNSNGRADALSRRADYNQGEDDNENVVVLPEELFIRTLHTIPLQNEQTLKPWVNAHNLIKIQGNGGRTIAKLSRQTPKNDGASLANIMTPPLWDTQELCGMLGNGSATDLVDETLKHRG